MAAGAVAPRRHRSCDRVRQARFRPSRAPPPAIRGRAMPAATAPSQPGQPPGPCSLALATPEQGPAHAADDVLPESRADDLAAGPDSSVDSLLLSARRVTLCLLLPLAFALGRLLCGGQLLRLPRDLALLL